MLTWLSLELLTQSLIYNRVITVAYFYNAAIAIVFVFDKIYVKQSSFDHFDIGFVLLIFLMAVTSTNGRSEDATLEGLDDPTKDHLDHNLYEKDEESKNLEDMVR